MKTTATIEMSNMPQNITVSSPATIVERLEKTIVHGRFAVKLAAVISFILNEKVSTAKSMHLLHAIVAGTSAFLFGGYSWIVQVLLLVWFAATVWQCRKDGWKA